MASFGEQLVSCVKDDALLDNEGASINKRFLEMTVKLLESGADIEVIDDNPLKYFPKG